MRLSQYSTEREPRPGLPSAEEIKQTTQVWRGDTLAKQEAVKPAATKPPKHESQPIADRVARSVEPHSEIRAIASAITSAPQPASGIDHAMPAVVSNRRR